MLSHNLWKKPITPKSGPKYQELIYLHSVIRYHQCPIYRCMAGDFRNWQRSTSLILLPLVVLPSFSFNLRESRFNLLKSMKQRIPLLSLAIWQIDLKDMSLLHQSMICVISMLNKCLNSNSTGADRALSSNWGANRVIK